MLDAVTYTEPIPVRRFYVSGMKSAEHVGGGNFCFTFYVIKDGVCVDEVCLFAPMEAVPHAIMLAAKAIGLTMFVGSPQSDSFH